MEANKECYDHLFEEAQLQISYFEIDSILLVHIV